MILLTGAAGFIGSNLLAYLNKNADKPIIIVDDFRGPKLKNIERAPYQHKIHRDQLFDWLLINGELVTAVFHLGARTDTIEKNHTIFRQLNLNYSKRIWKFCSTHNLPLVYASSAATYGLGELGFTDSHTICTQLKPLNPYAQSKNDFDIWALQQSEQPPFWAGIKFFNVYGPQENHKGRMASVIFHAFHQIRQTQEMKLFRSHHPNYKDGYQSRDFIYVADIVKLCSFFMNQQPSSGLYNAGTGQARTFLDLVTHTFRAMGKRENIQYIDTPIEIRNTYQYFTEAEMKKTREAGFEDKMLTLEEGVGRYVQYLINFNR